MAYFAVMDTTAHLFVFVSHVSFLLCSDREGWAFVDQLPQEQVCNPTDRHGTTKLPIVLHYCERYDCESAHTFQCSPDLMNFAVLNMPHRYMYGPMFFSKYRLKKNIMDCDKRLMQPPPSSFVGQYNYSIDPPRYDK